MKIVILAGLACLIAQGAFAENPTCTVPDDPAAAGVRAARAAFNTAIAGKDIDAISAVLADDVVLVTGTASELTLGRSAQLALWQGDFEAANPTVYERKSQCISMSPLLPIALETGAWRGVNTADAGNFAAGSFAAKWRLIDGAWRLEAEIYATESCGGDFCPAASTDDQ